MIVICYHKGMLQFAVYFMIVSFTRLKIALALVRVINYSSFMVHATVISIVNYDPKAFIVQATEHMSLEQKL
jgi:hypothetical protein